MFREIYSAEIILELKVIENDCSNAKIVQVRTNANPVFSNFLVVTGDLVDKNSFKEFVGKTCRDLHELVYKYITDNKRGYVTVYMPIAGYKAIRYDWYPFEKDDELGEGGMYEPTQTGMFGYATALKATITEGWDWALSEDSFFIFPLN